MADDGNPFDEGEGLDEEPVPDTAIIEAAKYGDLAKVEQLIAEGADPGAAGLHGSSPLIHACWNGHSNVLKLLLQDERVDPGSAVEGSGGMTAIMYASQRGHLDVVKLLLAHSRADPTAITTGGAFPGYTAIKYAVVANSLPVVELLLSDVRVVRALRKEDGVSPAAIERAAASPASIAAPAVYAAAAERAAEWQLE